MLSLQLRVLSAALSLSILWTASHAFVDVAFSAGVTSHVGLSSGQKMTYGRVFANVGSALNASTGVFTCPQSGVYMFQVFALTSHQGMLWLDLYHNSSFIITAYARTNYAFATGGNAVILEVREGDTVYVKSHSGSNLYGDPGQIYATFTGHLISPLINDFP